MSYTAPSQLYLDGTDVPAYSKGIPPTFHRLGPVNTLLLQQDAKRLCFFSCIGFTGQAIEIVFLVAINDVSVRHKVFKRLGYMNRLNLVHRTCEALSRSRLPGNASVSILHPLRHYWCRLRLHDENCRVPCKYYLSISLRIWSTQYKLSLIPAFSRILQIRRVVCEHGSVVFRLSHMHLRKKKAALPSCGTPRYESSQTDRGFNHCPAGKRGR